MSSVPLSQKDLEKIVEVISRDLLEQWAINDRFKEDEMSQAVDNALEDTVFIVSEFMQHFNELMMTKAQEQGMDV